MKSMALDALVAALVLVSGSVHSQINPFPDHFQLTEGDLDRLRRTVNQVLEAKDTQPGKTAFWKNVTSGSSGSVEVLQVSRRNGQPCKRLRYVFKIAKMKDPQSFVIDYCLIEDGTWKSIP